jgi:TolA-binding protein
MPDNPRTLYNFFYGFLVNKKKREAMQYYDHLLKTFPDSEFAEKAKEQLEIDKLKNP